MYVFKSLKYGILGMFSEEYANVKDSVCSQDLPETMQLIKYTSWAVDDKVEIKYVDSGKLTEIQMQRYLEDKPLIEGGRPPKIAVSYFMNILGIEKKSKKYAEIENKITNQLSRLRNVSFEDVQFILSTISKENNLDLNKKNKK